MKLPARTKPIIIDGAVFLIAPLTLRQATDFLERQKGIVENEQLSREGKIQELAKSNRQLIADAMNNASGKIEVTEDAIFEQVDMVSFTRLLNEILKFSGLASLSSDSTSGAQSDRGEAIAAS